VRVVKVGLDPHARPSGACEAIVQSGRLFFNARARQGAHLSPPLIVTEAQIEEIVGLVQETLDAYAAELRSAGIRLG
jgi:hypothetical protein